MATERKEPDVLVASTGLTGIVSDIQADPDTKSGSWTAADPLRATGNNVSTDIHCSFGSPSGDLTVGADLQGFRILLRPFDSGQTGDPDWRIELWEFEASSWSLVRAGSTTQILNDAGDTVVEFTWNANELTTISGENVGIKVFGVKTGGSPTIRNTVDFGAVEWNVDYAVSDQTLIPGGIATAEAIGSAQVNLSILAVGGIATAEAIGAAQINLSLLSVGGIATAEAIGSPVVDYPWTILAAGGIATAEAIGSVTLERGQWTWDSESITFDDDTDWTHDGWSVVVEATTLLPTGIASAEAVGDPLLDYPWTIIVGGIASAEVVPTPTILAGNVNVLPGGIASLEVIGSPEVINTPIIEPTGIASAEIVGGHTLQATYNLLPAGIASVEAIGSHIVTGGFTLNPTAVPSAEAIGIAQLNMTILSVGGIASAEAIGTANFTEGDLIFAAGIPPGKVGTPTILGGLDYQSSIVTRLLHGLTRDVMRNVLGVRK